MIDVRFVAPTLRQLDLLQCEALSIGWFADERPPTGLLSQVDWRLGGFLSRLMLRGVLRGDRQETTLMPGHPRLPFDKLLLFGLGPSTNFGVSDLDDNLRRMFATWSKLRLRGSAVLLPGRSLHKVSAETAIGRFVDLAQSATEQDEFVLIEPDQTEAQMQPILERAKRTARAPVL